MLLAPGAICSTYRPSRRNCRPIPCSGSVLKGTASSDRCQRSSELRCAPAVVAFVGKLVAEVA